MTLDYAREIAARCCAWFAQQKPTIEEISFIIRSFIELCLEADEISKNPVSSALTSNVVESGRVAVRVGKKGDNYCLFVRFAEGQMMFVAAVHHENVHVGDMQSVLMQLTLEFAP